MSKTSLATAAALILGLGATQAMAEINGFYGGAGIGVPDYAGGAKGIADDGGPVDDMDAIIGGEDGAWQGFIGYRFNRHWAVEAGYADLGHGVDDGQTGVPSNPEKYHAKAWSLSLLGHAPVTERFSLYGKFGAAFWDIEREDTDTGIFNDDSDESGTGVVFGLGADYQVNHNMSLRASWDHYHDMGSKSDVDDPGNMGVSVISLNLMLHPDRALLGPVALGSGSDSGFYIGAGGGIADYDGLICDGTPADCYNIGNDMDNELVDKDAAWQMFAGYQFNDYWSIEGAYTDLGRARNHQDDPSDTFDAQLVSLGLIGSLPVTERMAIHAKLGGAYYDVTRQDGETSVRRKYKDNGSTLMAGIGASYQLTSHFSVRANYDYYRKVGRWDEFDTTDGDTEGVGEAGISMVSLNLMYHFAPMQRMASPRWGGDKNGFYLGAGGGVAEHAGLEGATSDYDLGKNGALQLFGGYQFSDSLAAELAYVDLGHTYDDDSFPWVGGQEAKIDLWSLSMLASTGITDRLSAYAKVGATRWDVRRDQAGPGGVPAKTTNDDNGYGWTVGLGATYEFDNHLGMRASWDYYPDMGDPDSDHAKDTGEHDAHTYMISLYKRF